MRLRLRRRQPEIFEDTAVLVLRDQEGREMYRADLPLEIRRDESGLYPILAEIEGVMEEPFTVAHVSVEMRFRKRTGPS